MSEKRFVLFECANQEHLIRDTKIEKFLNMFEINHQLNEQQTTISRLEKEKEQLRKELDNFKPVMFQDMGKGTVILYSKGDIDE